MDPSALDAQLTLVSLGVMYVVLVLGAPLFELLMACLPADPVSLCRYSSIGQKGDEFAAGSADQADRVQHSVEVVV